MKTAQVIGSKTLGGAERWFFRFTRALAARGEPTHAIVRRNSELVPLDWGAVKLDQVPMHTVWDPVSRWGVRRALARLAPDLVQTYMGRATRLIRFTGPRFAHGRPAHVARLGNYYKLDSFSHCDAWIGNTRGICDYMIRGGLPVERVHLIYNFADVPEATSAEDLSSLRAQWTIPADAWVLMSPGRFTPIKGFDDLLQGFARLAPDVDGRPVVLLVLGDGPQRAALEALAAQLGIGERLRFTGWQIDPGPYYDLADLIVFPAKRGEPFGNVLLEAWAHGKPLLATEFLGAQEVTCHGEDAWRVTCDDPSALTEGVQLLLEDAALREGLAERGHARVMRDFSCQAIVDRYLALYRKLVGA
jgi:glycosyltransferase involved in cell wall biosynthesis